jgi:hypothetical protein
MDYTDLWKVLEELYNELTKKEVTVPQEFMNDLKSVKTLINIYKVDTTTLNVATEIELYLEKIESNLLYLAESDIGKEYAENWLKKIYEARKKGLSTKTTLPSRFVSGVPKNEHWIRIKTTDLIKDQDLEVLLDKFNLSSKIQKDEYLLIHGNEQNVKNFLKEVGKKIRKKS